MTQSTPGASVVLVSATKDRDGWPADPPGNGRLLKFYYRLLKGGSKTVTCGTVRTDCALVETDSMATVVLGSVVETAWTT